MLYIDFYYEIDILSNVKININSQLIQLVIISKLLIVYSET